MESRCVKASALEGSIEPPLTTTATAVELLSGRPPSCPSALEGSILGGGGELGRDPTDHCRRTPSSVQAPSPPAMLVQAEHRGGGLGRHGRRCPAAYGLGTGECLSGGGVGGVDQGSASAVMGLQAGIGRAIFIPMI